MPLVQLDSISSEIARVTFNDPDRLNALSLPMASEFKATMHTLKQDPKLRCVILTGSGRAFSAGGNLDMIYEKVKKDAETNRREMLEFYGCFLSLIELDVPTIAAINGPAIGAGCCVALACDLRLAADTAKLGVNFTKLGLSPGMAGSWLIQDLAGSAVANDLIFTGRTVEATEALQMRLVNALFPNADLEAKALALAQSIAANAPVAVRQSKQLLRRNRFGALPEALDREARAQAVCFGTQDLLRGVEAVKAKKPGAFLGN